MAKVKDVLRICATANNCNFSPFSQMEAMAGRGIARDEGGGGICYGLAVTWLESKLKGTASTFLHSANDVMVSNIFARSHLIWRNQNSGMWKTLTGLRSATDADGDAKKREFDDMQQFTAWLSSSTGTRYFLVHVPGHTMGACGSKMGKVEFFDPNGGIISSMHASRVAACLTQYFQAVEIKSYKTSPQNKLILTVEKLKGA